MNSADLNSTHSGHADDAHKSPERLEQEVNQTRARIEDRLVSLTHRLSPGELLDQALGMAREHGSEIGHNLGSQVKANPVPLLLTGIGLAWLMMGPRTPAPGSALHMRERYARGSEYAGDSEYGAYAGGAEYAGEYPRDYQSPGAQSASEPGMLDKAKDALGSISEKAHGFSDRAHQAAGRVGDQAHGAAERAQHLKGAVEGRVTRASQHLRERSQHLRERSLHVRERMHSSQQQLSDFFREQPILAGGLGVALGAALGALLPPTETEDRLMGRSSADAVEKAKAAAGEKLSGVREKARDTARGAVETLKENMHELRENIQQSTQQTASSEAGAQQGSGSPYAAAPENSAQNNPSVY